MADQVPSPHELSEVARDLAELEQEAPSPAEEDARRQGDALLLAALERENYSGRHTDAFLDRLTRYGLAVIGAWLFAGVLDDKAKRVGRPPRRNISSLSLTEDDRLAIADLTVAHGLALFRRAVFEEERWRPDGGASLTTYFVRSCLLTYSNAVKAWRPDREVNEVPAESLDDLTSDGSVDPCELVTDRETAWATVDSIGDPLTRRIVVLKSQGLTNKQVAEHIGEGLTEGAVELRLNRLRRRVAPAPKLANAASQEEK